MCSAGLELALCADVRIAADNARFSLPELAQGLLPLAGGSQRLTRIAGRGAAASMLLLGEELDAPSALRCGLVSRIVPAKDLLAEAEALASRVAERGPIALRYAKEATETGGVSDSTWSKLRGYFDTQEAMEVCLTVAWYNCVVRILLPLQIEHEPGFKRN